MFQPKEYYDNAFDKKIQVNQRFEEKDVLWLLTNANITILRET